MSLLVDAGRHDEIQPWDKVRIAEALVKEADIEPELAFEIARAVEEKIFASGIRRVSTALIRELVDNELFERGLSRTTRNAERRRHARVTTSSSSSSPRARKTRTSPPTTPRPSTWPSPRPP